MEIEVLQGDITKIAVDCIVNAANERLLSGGGVCGTIFKAAGSELNDECRKLGHCPTGSAVLTKAYNLPSKYIIHAVGPIWYGGNSQEPELLASCYLRALEIAAANNILSIAFPCISTGIYGFPSEQACKIALKTVRDFVANQTAPNRIIFMCFDPKSFKNYKTLSQAFQKF